MKNFILSSAITLTIATMVGCEAAGNLLGNQTELLTNTLSPICVKEVDKSGFVPKELEKLVTTKEICDCAIEKATTNVSKDLSQVPELLQDTDKQLDFILNLSKECVDEIGKKKLAEAIENPGKAISDLLTGGK